MSITEHDIVKTIRYIENIPKGTYGTVIHVYPKVTHMGEYVEVEFDEYDNTILTLNIEKDIEKVLDKD